MRPEEFFTSLEPHIILDAVENFGLSPTGRQLALNSMENRVYMLEIDNEQGNDWVVAKFYRPGRWSWETILEEHLFLEQALKREIPVVAPLKKQGETLFVCPQTQLFYAIFPRQGGRSPEDLQVQDWEQLARLLARLHAVGSISSAKHRMHLTPQTYGLDNLEQILKLDAIPKHLSAGYQQIVQQICQLSEPLFLNRQIQRIHGDCHLSNILMGPQGFFLLDFDDMLMGPPVQDFWLLFPDRRSLGEELMQKFIQAYESMHPFDHGSLRMIESLRALRMIHFNTWIAKRWEDPAFQRAFPQFAEARYFEEQIHNLREQISFIQMAGDPYAF